MSAPPAVIFDFPTAFAAVEPTEPGYHHEQCSYRAQNRALLCDCAAIVAARRAYELGVQHAKEGRR